MNDNEYIDVEEMTEYLMNNYREFQSKNKKPFMKCVQKAYEWQMYKRRKNGEIQSNTSNDAIILDQEDEVIFEKESKNSVTSSVMQKLYKKDKACASPGRYSKASSIDDDEDCNFPAEIQQVSSKKRKKKVDQDIEDLIKRKKKRDLIPEHITATFSDMAGIEKLKDKIGDLLANLHYPGVLKPLQKSMLLTGPTGSGKTMFAQALAGTSNVPLFRITATELVGGVSGESEERVKDTFEQAAAMAPCIMLLEKIDVISPKEGSSKSMERRMGAQLSSCLQLLRSKFKDKKMLVFGETSHAENLEWDIRSSFDDEMFMSVPDESARYKILQLLCKESPHINLDEIAHRTPGYMPGDLKRLSDKAQGIAWKRKRDTIFNSIPSKNFTEQLQTFLEEFGKMCGDEQQCMVEVNMEDFMEALLQVTPALKREGFPTVPDVTWQDIGGLDDIKKELREKILEPIRFAKLHEEYGARRPNGILMWGPPGCGKTLLAKAVANEAGINLLPVMGPELLNMYQGESERAVREVFHKAASVAPCVIFFDEFDSLCPVRTKGAESGSKTTIVNTLLTEMNGFQDRKDVYVIGATNRPDILDPAITRPGRFDTLLYVGLPDYDARIAVLSARTKNGTCPKLSSDVKLPEIARMCDNFSGADCDQLVYLASKEAIREVITANDLQNTSSQEAEKLQSHFHLVSKKHFSTALKRIKPSVSIEEQRRYRKLHSSLGMKKFVEGLDDETHKSACVGENTAVESSSSSDINSGLHIK
ncbi:nuclear valosin-containing protein-like isoform X2 [Oratosquilla oratoria]